MSTVKVQADLLQAREGVLTPPVEARQPQRLSVIYNPTAGGRRRRLFEKVMSALEAAGCQVALNKTSCAGDAERLAAELASESCDRLVVAGGDGTLNEVVNGLASSASAPPLALIPLGTANVLASEIGLPVRADSIVSTILDGLPRPISLGAVNGRRFVLMAGAGFDAWTVADVDIGLKRRIGKGAYVWSTLRSLFRFPFERYQVIVDGVPHSAASVVIANARHYGGPYVIAPDASLERPDLEVCLFRRGGRFQALRYGAALVLGRLPSLSDLDVIRGTTIQVSVNKAPGEPVRIAQEPVQSDGDIVAQLPAEIVVEPRALELVYPA